MASDALIIRFPDGTREFRFPEPMLEEGDVVWHDGARYHVVSISTDGAGRPFAVVEAEDPSLGELLQSEEGAVQLTPYGA